MLTICKIACVLLITVLLSQTASATEVIIETWDDRTINCAIDVPAILMSTEFGTAHIDLDKLLTIANLGEHESSQEFIALTDGGYELRGTLAL